MRFLSIPLTLSLLVLAAGCSTPEARIKKNPEMFNTLPDDVKSKVEQGTVDIGFEENAVFLALGKPDREYQRTTEMGVTKVWSWVAHQYYTERQRVRATFNVRDSDGRLRSVRDDAWVDVRSAREYEETRIEMRSGKVVAIEIISR